MKHLMFILSIACLVACNTASTNTDITGTYIHHTADETGQLWDTLEIHALNAGENLYTVVKKSGILYIRDGKDTLPIEHKKTEYTATYDKSSKNFHIKELAADYILDPATQTISNNQVKFMKAK